MTRERKGRIKYRESVRERLLLENIRRVLIAALISIVLFCVAWISLLIEDEQFGSLGSWLAFGGFVVIEALFMVLAFWILANRSVKYAFACVGIYWGVEGILLNVPVFFSMGETRFMVYLILALIILSITPILELKSQIAVLVYDLLIILIHLAMGNLEPGSLFYCLVIVALCNVIAAQSFLAFYRRVSDASIIHSAKNQAETDPMTQLYNRRGLERRVGNVWPVCERQKLTASIIMMDIDNFKKYNDTFGHAAGDECIKAVAGVIRENARRKTDYAARVGGEEFLVFLTGMGAEETLRWAEKCKGDVERLRICHAKDNPLPYISVSMGVCHVMPADGGMEFWEARNEADRSLYQAKEAGRACIFMDNKMYAKTYPEPNAIRVDNRKR